MLKPALGRLPRPIEPDPRSCSMPDCESEGIHRWQSSSPAIPLDLCEPHHKEAERFVAEPKAKVRQ